MTKQEHGRQGRNGARGTCLDIIDYSVVEQAYQTYLKTHPERMRAILSEQTQHLEQKLAKHARLGRPLSALDSQKYLITRSVEQLKHAIKQEQNMFIERKNALFAVLSGHIIAVLQQDAASESLRRNWLACRKAVDQLWNRRLADQPADSEAIYTHFIEKANTVWQDLCKKEPTLNDQLVNDFAPLTTEPRPSGSGNHAPVHSDEMVMPILVDFYQQWINGAEDTYFHPSVTPNPQVMTTLYGTNYEGLNAFYSALQSTAVAGNDDAQGALLLTLTHVLQSRAAFTIDLSTYADVIHRLVPLFDHPDYAHYLEGLAHFFTQAELNQRSATEQTPEDIQKNSRLFALTMQIITTQFIDDDIAEPASFKLITGFSRVIHDSTIWAGFDDTLAERIASVFATDAEITRLLTAYSVQPADLKRCIELIKQSDNWIVRKDALCQYLKAEAASLVEYPETIRPVFELMLAGRQSENPATDLPTPHCLPTEDHDLHAKFWHYLSQRSPVKRADSDALITILNAYHADNEAHLHAIIHAMNALPPHIPLSFINKHLLTLTGEYNIEHCLVRLKTIQKAGEQWCAFMHDRNWIQSEHEFKHPLPPALQNVDAMLACFDAMLPERSSIFFETIKPYLSLDVEMIQRISTAFTNDVIVDKAALQHVLQMADTILKWEDPVSRTAMREQFLALLAAHPEQLIDPHGRFKLFVDTLSSQAISMERSAIIKLWQAWNDNRIQTAQQLRHSIQVIHWAMHAKTHQQALDDLFLSIDSKQVERQAIMQHLEHDLLDLGDAFKRTCYNKYQRLSEQLPRMTSEYNIHDRLSDLRHSFLSLMKWAREMMVVATHPFQARAAIANPAPRPRGGASHQAFFIEQEKGYANSWWVNSARRKQAFELFDTLVRINGRRGDSKSAYYHAVLNAIWTSQQTMLRQDKAVDRNAYFYKLNTKGYSRLHDISMQMFARVARDFLAEADITVQEKEGLNAMLQAQLVFYINELEERLPDLNPLKNEIARIKNLVVNRVDLWEPDSIELGLLKTAIEANRETLPKHLHYLLTPIDLATELSMGNPGLPLRVGPL